MNESNFHQCKLNFKEFKRTLVPTEGEIFFFCASTTIFLLYDSP